MIGFYHSRDLDGQCCGAILKMRYPDIELIGHDYGYEFPWKKIKDQDVIMADIAFDNFADMIRLQKEAKSFIWIDHHKTAILDREKHGLYFDGIQKMDKSACEYTWEYFYGSRRPLAVYLLGRYDVWDHSAHKDVLNFQYGIKQYDTKPENQWLWKELFNHESDLYNGKPSTFLESVIKNGKILVKFVEMTNTNLSKMKSFETELGGLKFLAANMLIDSDTLKAVYDPVRHDAMCGFVWLNGKWKFSLRSKKNVDILKIAKSFGGGGHPKACGFECKELPVGFLQ